ncbi:MAG: phosphate acyltransferase PlsX [Pseudomonadota bacterium]
MTDIIEHNEPIRLAVDAMGADAGPETVVDGVAAAVRSGVSASFTLFGDEQRLSALLKDRGLSSSADAVHADAVVSMTDKPSQVLRRGRNTSMWSAIEAVKNGDAQAVISGGNTGALMAMSKLQLRMIDGVDRPAITALWPTPRGRVVVLDVGANVEANAEQLVQFAIMGEAFFRAMTAKGKPTVGLLNVGAEELKGHELIRTAARVIKDADPEMAFSGFIEGDDISKGTVDVVVTDGFSGNIALKSAEGAARLVGSWMKDALTGSLFSKLGALLMMRELKNLKQKIDPSSVNGGVFLGLNGLVIKSHGGADANGVASAVALADSLARRPFRDEVAATVERVARKAQKTLQDVDAEIDSKAPGAIKAVV